MKKCQYGPTMPLSTGRTRDRGLPRAKVFTLSDVAAVLQKMVADKRAAKRRNATMDTNSASLAELNRREREAAEKVARQHKDFWKNRK
jgi:hypothetical protein